jgi:SAM-dependent methyltransferase
MSSKPAQALATEWWEDNAGFFGKKYIEGDDSIEGFLSTPQTLEVRTTREVDGIVRLLSLAPGSSVLDCPCGYGRHSIALAGRGFQVQGSDLNGEMLALARQRADGTGNLRFACENMLDLVYRETFDAVINMFLAFGFFEEELDNVKVMANFHRALRPGGRFLLHTDVNPSRIVKGSYRLHEHRTLRSGRMLEIVESFDPARKRLNGQWILIDRAGAREELPAYSCRIYTAREITELCKSVGFSSVEVFGSWEGDERTDDSEEMIVVATKGGR